MKKTDKNTNSEGQYIKTALLSTIGTQASFIESMLLVGATMDEMIAKIQKAYPSSFKDDAPKAKRRINNHLRDMKAAHIEGRARYSKNEKTGVIKVTPIKKVVREITKEVSRFAVDYKFKSN